MLTCCKKCEKYNTCERKWILGERGIKASCCAECSHYRNCILKNTKERWKIIHGRLSLRKK